MLLVCVVVSGAAVMIAEFVAVRILARYFGSALDTWGSVFVMLLGGLSAGYALGGLLADRYGSARPIGLALIVAGLSGAAMEPLARIAGEAMVTWERGLVLHPYLAAGAIAFVPTTALGTVLPQAIRLRAAARPQIGAAAGWVSAVSTLGSILGVVLTVHVLLPHVGVRHTMYGLGAVLAALGAVVAGVSRKAAVPLLAVCLGLLVAVPAGAQVIYDQYSAYHHVLVEDTGGQRLLRFNNDVQSTMSLRDPYAGGFEYTDFFHLAMVLDPAATRVLFIGLGGGTGPKAFLRDYSQVRVDVAEIDPMVITVARTWFAVPEDPRLTVRVGDGRVVLSRAQTTYGAVIVDAYATGPYGSYIPYQLATREFFELAWRRLDNGGTVIYNVIGVHRGMLHDTVHALYATLASVFQAVYAFQALSSQNTVLVAQKIDPGALQPDGTRSGQGWPQDPWLRHPLSAAEWAGLVQALQQQGRIRQPLLAQRVGQVSGAQHALQTGTIYTDDYAPVDVSGQGPPARD